MSDPVYEVERVAARQQSPPPVERRKTARTLLRDVEGTMSWRGDAVEIAREVSVLNISGAGAALLAEDGPPAGQMLRLRLHVQLAGMEPIEGQVIETRPHSSGKRVVHVRFARWVPLDWLLENHRERRRCERYPARASRAVLTWPEGATEQTIRGDLPNISGGGGAFASDVRPPPGGPLWLGLEAGAGLPDRIQAVESRLVTTSAGASGRRIAHIPFVDPCPMDHFERAVDGPG